MKKFISVFFFLAMFGYNHMGFAQAAANNSKVGQLTCQVISSENNTWGYDIYRNNKLFVHQPCIPGMQGNEGFKTKKSAETVAKEVIEKIKRGDMPPTITVEELKKLNAI